MHLSYNINADRLDYLSVPIQHLSTCLQCVKDFRLFMNENIINADRLDYLSLCLSMHLSTCLQCVKDFRLFMNENIINADRLDYLSCAYPCTYLPVFSEGFQIIYE